MAGDLVAGSRDAPHERRCALGHPAQYEEGRAYAALRQDSQQALGVGLDAQFAARPAVARDRRTQRRDMEVILHVDGERIE